MLPLLQRSSSLIYPFSCHRTFALSLHRELSCQVSAWLDFPNHSDLKCYFLRDIPSTCRSPLASFITPILLSEQSLALAGLIWKLTGLLPPPPLHLALVVLGIQGLKLARQVLYLCVFNLLFRQGLANFVQAELKFKILLPGSS
jgi:hypothetical protein